MKTKVFALCMLLVTLLCAVSCNLFNQDDEEEEERTFTVSFYDIQPAKASSYYDEVFLSSQSVEEGNTVSKPADPVDKWGRTFLGWFEEKYIDTDGDNIAELSYIVFDFTTIINSHKELYAKWDGDLVPVYFDLNDGTTPNDYTTDGYDRRSYYNSYGYGGEYGDYVIYAAESGTVKAPVNPVKSGYKFVGWYTSIWSDAKLFDFNTSIEEREVLYAKWVTADTSTYTVTFESNGGTNVQSQILTQQTTLSYPIAPKRDGYNFAGWYSDISLSDKFYFDNPIIGDITLYAKWISVEESCIVTFVSNCDRDISNRLLYKGEKVKEYLFSYTAKPSYTFKGWYTDKDFKSAFDFDTPVYSDMTLYAKWVVSVPELTISTNSVSNDYAPTIYIDGKKVSLDSSTSVEAFWTSSGADSYKLYYNLSNDTSSAVEAITTIKNQYSYPREYYVYIPNFTTGKTYYFWVKAFLSNGDESDFSEVATYTKE